MGEMPDLSSLFEMLNNKGINVNNIMQNFSNNASTNNNDECGNFQNTSNNETNNISNYCSNSSNQNTNSANQQSNQMPDMETMMKIMKLMNSMNSNTPNPSADLLYSLKPFLRDSKKEKIDQYIKFLKISSILSEMNKSGGDSK